MSTEHQRASDEAVSTPNLDPDGDVTTGERALAFFEAVVWADRAICSNCFARVRRRTVDAAETDEGSVRRDGAAGWTQDAVRGEDLEAPPESAVGVKPLARSRITCGACGSVGAIAQWDTLSRREALERVPALVERVEERGYRIDAAVVRRAVRHLKSQPDHGADDKRVFATAVALGVDRA